jgi:mitochondrial splicing suppressor protein 51
MVKDVIAKDFTAISKTAREVSPVEEQEAQERMRMFLLLCTDTLTMPLTILAGLERLRLDAKPELNIHLLGATGRELMALSSFEEIMHLVPGLKSVHVTAVGPGSWTDAPEKLDKRDARYFPAQDMSCCAECAQQGRKRSVASWRGVYHDFVNSAVYDGKKERPDLIVAFNSGIVDGDDADTDWAPTIKVILDTGVPSLFTTYNEHELGNETSMWKKKGARFLVEPQENRWRGLVPSPEFLDREGDIWYQNWGWYVVQK